MPTSRMSCRAFSTSIRTTLKAAWIPKMREQGLQTFKEKSARQLGTSKLSTIQQKTNQSLLVEWASGTNLINSARCKVWIDRQTKLIYFPRERARCLGICAKTYNKTKAIHTRSLHLKRFQSILSCIIKAMADDTESRLFRARNYHLLCQTRT